MPNKMLDEITYPSHEFMCWDTENRELSRYQFCCCQWWHRIISYHVATGDDKVCIMNTLGPQRVKWREFYYQDIGICLSFPPLRLNQFSEFGSLCATFVHWIMLKKRAYSLGIKNAFGGVCCHTVRGRVRTGSPTPRALGRGIWRTVSA